MNLTNQTLLITGIGGFIGLRAAEIAIARGMKVRGLQHSEAKANQARKLGAEVILGSITDPIAVQKACQGVDIVLHTAAIVQEAGLLALFREVNVGGTMNLAHGALKAGVKTFVYLSSVAVYGFNYPDSIAEDGPLNGEKNSYCQTKIEAEQVLFHLNNPPDFGVIIIRPGDVYGPRSLLWVVRPLRFMRQNLFILANGGRGVINHVYVDNLIDGIFLAIKKEAYGEAFNLTDGENTSCKTYFSHLAQIGGFSAPSSLPAPVLKGLIQTRCSGQRLSGSTPDILPDSIDFLIRRYAYSIEKAQSKLGYQPTISLKEGMQYIQEWLKTTNCLDVSKDY